MRDESAPIVRDGAIGFADPDSPRLLSDDPAADHRPVAGDFGKRRERLVDESLLTVVASGLRKRPSIVVEGHVRAFAGEERLLHVAGQTVLPPIEVRLEKVGVVRVELPEDRKNSLARKNQLPGRLDPLRGGVVHQKRREVLVEHPFPRIELEDGRHRLVPDVHEQAPPVIPADLGDEQLVRRDGGLRRRVAQVRDRHDVFHVVERRELERLAREVRLQLLPRRDQPLVDRVELVPSGEHLLEPLPLDDRGLVQRRRSVGVVLEQLRRRLPVVREIEPAVDRGRIRLPGAHDELARERRDAEIVPSLLLDDVTRCRDAHLLEPVGSALERVDLAGVEDVVGGLVPVRLTGRVERQAERLDLRLPVGTGLRLDPLQRGHSPAPWAPAEPLAWLAPVEPKPPRETPSDVEAPLCTPVPLRITVECPVTYNQWYPGWTAGPEHRVSETVRPAASTQRRLRPHATRAIEAISVRVIDAL